MREKIRNQDGASIVIAIILLLVVTIACTSLYYIIGTNVRSAGQTRDREQAMILAQSLSETVKGQVENQDSELGTYLSSYFGESASLSWGWYNPEEVFNSVKSSMTKTFTVPLTVKGYTDPLNATAEISMYWYSESAQENEMAAVKNYEGNQRALYVTSTVTIDGKAGKQSGSVTAVFDFTLKTGDSNYWWSYRGGE